MDTGETVPEKHLSNGRGEYHSPVFQVRDFDLTADIQRFLPIFWQAWFFVHGEDKSSTCRIKLNGNDWEISQIEALLYWYLHDEGSRIKLHLSDNAITGFVIYNRVLEGVFAIRLCYVDPSVSGSKIAFGLVSSIEGLKTIIFQTRKNIEPHTLFNITKGREIFLSETEDLKTWAMSRETK